MKYIIEISEEVKQAFDCAESNDLKGSYYDHGGVVGNAIKNGTPLPKGHGRLIDADALWKKWVFDAIGKREIDDAPTIIEADKKNYENDDYYKGAQEEC